MYDVLILGAGVTGCAVARWLSAYQARVCVADRASDVCEGTSKANSAIIHAGFDAAHGSKMAEYNVRGSKMLPELAAQLDFPFRRSGSLVVCLDEAALPRLQALYENGVKNGVEGLELLNAAQLREKEPNLSPNAVAALWAPTGGIVCPFRFTIALAENAAVNGVEFRLNTAVTAVRPAPDGTWLADTDKGTLSARVIVNAAGVYADTFHNMVSSRKIHITPRKGEYVLLDKTTGGLVNSTIFQLPDAMGKGVLVTPTVHGNTLVGPTALNLEDREDTSTTAAGYADLAGKAARTVPNLPLRQTITGFSGLRAHEDGHEFILGEVPDAPGFFDCAGIESPGLSSAPAIGEDTARWIAEKLGLAKKPDFIATRTDVPDLRAMPAEQRAALIRQNPAYGQIICRCEGISEGEIIDAIHRPLGAATLDGVKRRVRAGMGRCQGGFCSPRVMEILARELGIDRQQVTKRGGDSRYLVGTAKDSFGEENSNENG